MLTILKYCEHDAFPSSLRSGRVQVIDNWQILERSGRNRSAGFAQRLSEIVSGNAEQMFPVYVAIHPSYRRLID